MEWLYQFKQTWSLWLHTSKDCSSLFLVMAPFLMTAFTKLALICANWCQCFWHSSWILGRLHAKLRTRSCATSLSTMTTVPCSTYYHVCIAKQSKYCTIFLSHATSYLHVSTRNCLCRLLMCSSTNAEITLGWPLTLAKFSRMWWCTAWYPSYKGMLSSVKLRPGYSITQLCLQGMSSNFYMWLS